MVCITSGFIIGENLIWQFFTIHQTAKLKSSPNFPAIRYYLGKQSDKYWLTTQAHLVSMHTSMQKGKKGNVLLWCDANQANDTTTWLSESCKQKCFSKVPEEAQTNRVRSYKNCVSTKGETRI